LPGTASAQAYRRVDLAATLARHHRRRPPHRPQILQLCHRNIFSKGENAMNLNDLIDEAQERNYQAEEATREKDAAEYKTAVASAIENLQNWVRPLLGDGGLFDLITWDATEGEYGPEGRGTLSLSPDAVVQFTRGPHTRVDIWTGSPPQSRCVRSVYLEEEFRDALLIELGKVRDDPRSPAVEIEEEEPAEKPGTFVVLAAGMTLRDYFATSALQGLLGEFYHTHHAAAEERWDASDFADHAYTLADAMLIRRQQ
jgi:hypothetical protein